MLTGMVARMPVMRKLGITVIAGSHACHTSSGLHGGPIEVMRIPSGRTFPCMISKTPSAVVRF